MVVTGGVGISERLYAGSIQNTPIGSSTANTGAFTSLTANGAVTFTQNTASTNTSTGTLVVTGGIGVTGAVNTGASSTFAGFSSTNTTAISPSNAAVTISPTGTGGVTISPTGSGGLTINSTTTGTINNCSIGATTRSTGAFTTLAANDSATFTKNTGSTSTTSGTLVVTGGVGISERLYAGSIQNTPIGSSTANTGAFTSLTANGAVTFTQNTASTNTSTGTLVVTGGIGVTGAVNTGASSTFAGFSSTNTTAISPSNAAVTISPTGTGGVTISPTGSGGLTINSTTTGTINNCSIGATTRSTGAFTTLAANDSATFTKNTGSTSTTSGTLVVTGGVGISERLYAGSIQNTPIGSVTASSGAFTSLTTNGATTFTAGTSSTTTGTGTIVVTGGVGISENINVGGNAVITGNLTVNGTTTTINSTTLSVDDILIEVGAVATPTDTTANGGGLLLYGATNKTITWVQSTGYWTFNQGVQASSIQNTPIGSTTRNTGAFTSLAANGAVSLTAGTTSTSTGSGTLVVSGGTGISENLWVGGTANVAGVLTLSNTGYFYLPRGTSAQRPTAAAGMARYNTDTNQLEFYNGTTWVTAVRPWVAKTTTYTASNGDQILADTSAGSWTLTLPGSPTLGDTVRVVDAAGTFDTNALTIGRNGQPIMGDAADMTVNTENAGFTLVYYNSTYGWRLGEA